MPFLQTRISPKGGFGSQVWLTNK